MNNFRYPGSGFGGIPPVVKNLLILNVLAHVLLNVMGFAFDYNLIADFGLYYVKSDFFRPVQFVTHMFLHAPLWEGSIGIWHIAGNMFALWMFGSNLEQVWGPKRFLFFYFFTGLGAALTNSLATYLHIQYLAETGSNPELLKALYYIPTVGASGAVFGILAGFAMMFPNRQLLLLFFPFPIKAKYFVLIYAFIELSLGLKTIYGGMGGGISVAHFAHLGGALFGFILIKAWGLKRVDYF